MSGKYTKRDFLKMLTSTVVAPRFTQSAQAEGVMSELETRIKSHIALGYRLELADTPTTFTSSGTIRGCDPLAPVSETIHESMKTGETYTLKLTGSLVGLKPTMLVGDKTSELNNINRSSNQTATDIYNMLDDQLNVMAKEWAEQAKADPNFMHFLSNPQYTMIENCNYS